MLNARQTRFVQEYVIDFNGTQAAIRAGYSEQTAGAIASENLQKPEIEFAISERMADLAAAAALSTEWVLRQYMQIASADPSELTQVQRVNCRHCYGIGFEYQWDEREYLAAVNLALDAKEPQRPPAAPGGFGWDYTRDPHSDCPECRGRGKELVHVADTRKLSSAAKRLFSGVKVTKDGIEIKQRDQDGALRILADYQGMIKTRSEVSGPGGGPIPVARAVRDLSEAELMAIAQGDLTETQR